MIHHRISTILTLLFLIVFHANGQQPISGNVLDQTTREPISGAAVYSQIDSAITDKNGSFTLNTSGAATVTVQAAGYETQIITPASQTIEVLMAPSTFKLNEVTVSAGMITDKVKNVAGAVSVVDRKMLARDAPFSITDAVNRVPGVYMHTGSYSTNRITIRGIGSRSPYGTNKIKAYFDQIPLTDGSGNSTLEDIDQSLIKQIELLKGPNSSSFGAGLAGVVKLHSIRPETNVTAIESGLTVGSFNRLRWHNQLIYSDEKGYISTTYSKTKSGGYRENSHYHREQSGVTAGWRLTEKSELRLLTTFTSLKSYIPSSINENDYQNSPQSAASSWAAAKGYEDYDKFLNGITFLQDIGKNWQLSASVFHKYRDAYEPRPFNILKETTTSYGTRNVLSGNFKRIRISTGIEVFRDKYHWRIYENTEPDNGSQQGDLTVDNEEDRNYYNLFAEATLFSSGRFNVILGLNFNKTNYELNDVFTSDTTDGSGSYQFDGVFSPRIGLVMHLSPTHHLYANISHGFSPPTLEETLYPGGQINPNIQPEKGWNYELGIRGNLQNLSYDLVSYYMHITDLLVAQRTGDDQFYGVNAGLNKHLGVDLLLNYQVTLNESYSLNFFNSTSFMYYRFSKFNHDGNNYDGNKLTGVPSVIINTGVELLAYRGFYGNISGQFVGKIPIDDANTIFSDAYFIARSRMGYQFAFDQFSFDVFGGIANIFNEKYASMLLINSPFPRYYYPGDPRNYFGGLTIKYLF